MVHFCGALFFFLILLIVLYRVTVFLMSDVQCPVMDNGINLDLP